MNDLSCVKIACNIKDYDNAFKYFDSAYEHYTKFLELQNNEYFEDDYFDAPLLATVKNTSIPVVMLKSEYLKDIILYMPKEINEQIKNNPKYTALFD